MNPEISEDILEQTDPTPKKRHFKIRKNLFFILLVLIILFLCIEASKRISITNKNGQIRVMLSNMVIPEKDKAWILIKPGYYYSKALKINIIVPEAYTGIEELGVINLKKDKEQGEIVIEKKPEKYNSLDEGIMEIEKENPKLVSLSEKSDFENIHGYLGKSYQINQPDIYLSQYLIYVDHDIYSFYTSNPSLYFDLHELASQFKYSDSQITPVTRKAYDFEKILREKFFTFENRDIGFSIEYPQEDRPNIINSKGIKDMFGKISNNDPIGAVTLGLVSQPPGAYELYDGFSLDIVYYKNANNLSIESLAKQEGKGYDENETGIKLDGAVIIDGVKGWKLDSCCYGGGSYIYYFPTKNNQYFLRIDLFSTGQDRNKFLQVADKMINSLKFY